MLKNTPEIIENNKLIAEFMGITALRFEINEYSHAFNIFHNESIAPLMFPEFNAHYTSARAMQEFYETAAYSSSWDWLMTVVAKIEQVLNHGITITEDQCEIWNVYDQEVIISELGPTKIVSTYNAIITFIKSKYNTPNDQPNQ